MELLASSSTGGISHGVTREVEIVSQYRAHCPAVKLTGSGCCDPLPRMELSRTSTNGETEAQK